MGGFRGACRGHDRPLACVPFYDGRVLCHILCIEMALVAGEFKGAFIEDVVFLDGPGLCIFVRYDLELQADEGIEDVLDAAGVGLRPVNGTVTDRLPKGKAYGCKA